MAFQIGFDGIASAELTHILDNLSHNLNARMLLAQVQVQGDTGGASGVTTGGGGGKAPTPCPAGGNGPVEPDCLHHFLAHDPNTYVGGAIGLAVGLSIGIIVGAVIGDGICKLLTKATSGPIRSI
jgi:hypothetical protein